MSAKNFNKFEILTPKSIIALVIIAVILWFAYSQSFNYEDYYVHIQKSSLQLDNQSKFYFTTEKISSSSKTDLLKSTISSSFKTTNNGENVNGTVTTVSFIAETTTKSEEDVWFKTLIQLKNISQSDTNIFFIETSCGTEGLMKTYNRGVIHLNPRQCCAVESAALINRNHSAYILHTCPLDVTMYRQSPEYIKQTLAHPNVYIVYLRLDEIMQQSPVEGLYLSNKISSSRYPVEHMSDILRHLALWKYGGTYMDLDTINIRPLDDLKYNYAGWQDTDSVANGILNFKYNGMGHDIVTECLKELNNTFDGLQWSYNGPQLITRTLVRMCKFQTVSQLSKEKCDSFTLYPPKYFYPVYYPSYGVFFKEIDSQKVLDTFNGTFSIHFWNKMSSKSIVEVGSNQLYGVLANKYCPGVYHNCGKYF